MLPQIKTHQNTTIIAIGGGGFTHGCDADLEEFILSKSRCMLPRVGYIGIANYDDEERIQLFYDRFSSLKCIASHHAGLRSVEGSEWIAKQDVVYFGGGNTVHLVERLQTSGLDFALAEAVKRGTILCGVSAGAACWFDIVPSGFDGQLLVPIFCLGMVAGSCCPHYSDEPHRRPMYESQIAKGLIPPGLAIDDGVAALIEFGQPIRAFSARRNAGAYWVGRKGEVASVECCPHIEY